MRTVHILPASKSCYGLKDREYPYDHEYVKWSDVGSHAMGSGNVTGGKIHPDTGEVWIQKIEFGRLRYEVYGSVSEYREAIREYRQNIDRDPETCC